MGGATDYAIYFSVVRRRSTFSTSLAFQTCVGGATRVRHEYPAPVLEDTERGERKFSVRQWRCEEDTGAADGLHASQKFGDN